MRNIHDVRDELNCWGRFWAKQERGQGFSSKSNIETLREKLRLGCSAPGTSHLINHLADSVKVPVRIALVDYRVSFLSVEHRIALGLFYINNQRIKSHLLRSAERELL